MMVRKEAYPLPALFPYPPLQQNLLPRLSALSVQCTCADCGPVFTVLFAITAPNIQHLKFRYWYEDTPLPTSPSPDQNYSALRLIASKWEDRHGGCIPLRTLYLKDAPLSFPADVGRELTYLTHLHQTQHTDSLDMFPMLRAQKSGTQIHWSFTEESDMVTSPGGVLSIFSALSSLPRLSSMDLTIRLLLPDEDNLYAAQRDDTRSIYQQRSSYDSLLYQAAQRYHTTVRMPLIADAAQYFMDRIPSLRSGAFWESIGGIGSGQGMWHRWSWSVQLRPDGRLVPVVCETPELVSEAFMRNDDGYEWGGAAQELLAEGE
ncbi:hypothetical protein IAT38_003807 [Cryptococcus sp. DSM 104549]